MSVRESEICFDAELQVEQYKNPVDQIVRHHMPAVGQDELGIWAVRCYSCGELMLGQPRDREILVDQIRAQLRGEGP